MDNRGKIVVFKGKNKPCWLGKHACAVNGCIIQISVIFLAAI